MVGLTLPFSHAVFLHSVERVVDGDTVIIKNIGRVRLLGVDTPETVHPKKAVQHFGHEASAFTKGLLDGKKVRLEYDGFQKKDRYGRTLAYLFLEDGTFVNAEIIKQGFGHAYTRFPFERLEEFRQLEREAREAKRGLWADTTKPRGPPLTHAPSTTAKEQTVYITKSGKRYHRSHCRHLKRSRISIQRSQAQNNGYAPCKVCHP